tara:strand:- start:70 stop:510 length:441 start_codon:yes stop_codon:yes gene_type:complete
MKISKIHQLEKSVIMLLNIDGWDLTHTGEGSTKWDAEGFTPEKNGKRLRCVIEMKFRNKYYEEKMLEKDKYDSLMALDKDIIKLYFVNDTKGNFMYWLNTLAMPKTIKKYCPDTTIWTKKKLLKNVYLLKENDAVIINLNESKKII